MGSTGDQGSFGQGQLQNSEKQSSLGVLAERALPRRKFANTIARRLIFLGGVSVLFSITAILFVIAIEVLPLFRGARVGYQGEIDLPPREGGSLLAVMNEYRDAVVRIEVDGSVSSECSVGFKNQVLLPGEKILFAKLIDAADVGVLLHSGKVGIIRVVFKNDYSSNRRTTSVETSLQYLTNLVEGEKPAEVVDFSVSRAAGYDFFSAITADNKIVTLKVIQKQSLLAALSTEEYRSVFPLTRPESLTRIISSRDGKRIIVGDKGGRLLVFDTSKTNDLDLLADFSVSNSAVTTLGYLLGEKTVIVGDAAGGVASWLLLPDNVTGKVDLLRNHQFREHNSAVSAFSASQRNKGFVSADQNGVVAYHYGTTGKSLLRLEQFKEPIIDVGIAPKGDGIKALAASGLLKHWDLDLPHPEVNLRALFGKIRFEGHREAAFVWQSTGGNDEFEAKLNLVPLIVGTAKAAFYALIFAVPLGVFGALYCSQFLHPVLRGVIKPAVEMMAGLPSVVIGFVAGLWFAPKLDPHLMSIFIFPFVLLAICWATFAARRKFFPSVKVSNLLNGWEFLILTLPFFLAIWISTIFAGQLEQVFMGGDYRSWLFQNFKIAVEQRNSAVAGIAVAFAVIPIIFSISEDCISSVPKSLAAASLALGASRWQTAFFVIFPVAIPGIFAAIMIGIGRAVGETMIVLMATGNTPILDWSIFTGFRALSANIAVELPEAPHGGTLYRVLFLSACILFLMTFVLNTASEAVSRSFKKKFKQL